MAEEILHDQSAQDGESHHDHAEHQARSETTKGIVGNLAIETSGALAAQIVDLADTDTIRALATDAANAIRARGDAQPSPIKRRANRKLANALEVLLPRQATLIILTQRDISSLLKLLNLNGLSQRALASLVDRGQSEISEIINHRQVITYDTIAHFAAGLGIPPGLMGLAFIEPTLETDTPL